MALNEPDQIRTRPALPTDAGFLWEVQRSALGGYVREQFGSSEQQQREYFDRHFDVGRHLVVERGGEPIGFLFYEPRGDSIYLGNLALMPEHQGLGIGSMLVSAVLDEAETAGRAVTLQVLKSNRPARRFYERLGFVAVAATDSHIEMRSLESSLHSDG